MTQSATTAPSLSEMVGGTITLPSPPTVYLKVRQLVEDPKSTVKHLAKVVSADPGRAARLLALVNSPFYGMWGKVGTVTRALTVLGMRQVHDFVLSTSVIGMFDEVPARSFPDWRVSRRRTFARL